MEIDYYRKVRQHRTVMENLVEHAYCLQNRLEFQHEVQVYVDKLRKGRSRTEAECRKKRRCSTLNLMRMDMYTSN